MMVESNESQAIRLQSRVKDFMQNLYRIHNTRFLLRWVLSGLFVWLLGGVLSIAAGFVGFFVAMVVSTLLRIEVPFIAYWIVAGFVGAATGYAIGTIQQWLVRRDLYWELDHWTRWSMIGGAVAAIAVYSVLLLSEALTANTHPAYYHSNDYQTLLNLLLVLPFTAFVGILSVFQWRILRQFVHGAWLWVLANVVGGWVVSIVYVQDGSFLQWLIGAFALAAISGAVMLYLFQTQVRRQHLTPAPVPVRTDDSVWDQAI